jgi:Spy/CpxP family protein refolding chaperone
MKTVKHVITFMLLAFIFVGALAQENNPPVPPKPPKDMAQKRERVQAMKTAFITKELNLSPEEAQKFWPVYNKYANELKELQKAHREKMKDAKANLDSMNDKEAEMMVDNFLIHEQKELDLKQKYHADFKKVLPIRKVGKLYHSEEKFKKELLEKVKDQKPGMPQQPKQHMQQPPMPDSPPDDEY